MSNLIGIVNYGIAGNIHSIEKAIRKAGGDVLIINSPEDLQPVDKIVIPGVGSFKDAMDELKNDNLLEPLIKELKQKPTLGICLGMQILASVGYEYGETIGLGIIDAEVKQMRVDAKIPHMGFNNIEILKPCKLLNGLENEEFYFMHSYEVINHSDIISVTDYEEYKFVSCIQSGNVYGVQFHPEKSREAGIRLFKNFIEL